MLQWHAIRWCPGVRQLLLDGIVPARVPDRIIDSIRARERGGVVQLAPRLRRGDRIRIIRAGPWAGLEGLYDGQAAHERVAILLACLGRVILPRRDVEAI